MTNLVIDEHGTKRWYLNGNLHREDGPAIEGPSGTKVWYRNGKRHREDGPAVEYADGTKSWYLDGCHLDAYQPNFGCFEPKNRDEALERINSKGRPYTHDFYMADIVEMFPKGGE